MSRNRPDLDNIENRVALAVEQFRGIGEQVDATSWADIETFIAVALYAMRRTNPRHIRDAAMFVEIRARIHNKEVIE